MGKPHYHFLILLNRDAFHRIDKFEPGSDNISNRLVEAWTSALKLSVDEFSGLVHIPDNPTYNLRRDDELEQPELF